MADTTKTDGAIEGQAPQIDANGLTPAGGKVKTQKECTIHSLWRLIEVVEKEAKKAAKTAKFEAKKVNEVDILFR